MQKFIVAEAQNLASLRKGESIEVKDLTAARRKATAMQMFQGTALAIYDAQSKLMVSYKLDGKWHYCVQGLQGRYVGDQL